jgi:hypothetical protein
MREVSRVSTGMVGAACGAAAAGLWRGTRAGHRLAFAILTINGAGDLANAVLGTEPRAAIGVPVAAALLIYLGSASVRAWCARA